MNDDSTSATHPIDLVAEPRLHLRAPQSRETGRISIGAPAVRRLSAAEASAVGGEWGAFVAAEAPHSDFHLLSLACTFRPPANGAPLVEAAFGLRLASPGEPPERQPIAWSLSPKARTRPVERRTAVSFTAQLALVEAGVEVGPGSAGEDLFVTGMGERDGDPEWRFRAVPDHPLIGDETLTTVVRAAAGAPVLAHLVAAATLRHRRFGLIPYRAALPPTLRTIEVAPHGTTP
ncbi:hypothetical protein [Streptomyces avicenniae]|uniref:hypothetical protein n=1 Tax=Streptomyces avicenniae TaxID=500153 RepID=UPI00069AA8F0|nr:hypothetical protein [Streptomyces avicenniae]